MSKSLKQHKFEHLFNEFELKALEPLCTRLGKSLGDFSRGALKDHLAVCYNLPASARSDSSRSIAAIELAIQILGTVQRHEIGLHSADPLFVRDVGRLLAGDYSNLNYAKQVGLRGLVEQLITFSERGY